MSWNTIQPIVALVIGILLGIPITLMLIVLFGEEAEDYLHCKRCFRWIGMRLPFNRLCRHCKCEKERHEARSRR